MSSKAYPVDSYEVIKTTNTSHGVERYCRIDYQNGDVEHRWLRPTTFADLEKYKFVMRVA